MITYRGYSEDEAQIAVSDFPDLYTLPYLDEEFICEETVDGKDYEKNASYTSFWKCRIDDVPMFDSTRSTRLRISQTILWANTETPESFSKSMISMMKIFHP